MIKISPEMLRTLLSRNLTLQSAPTLDSNGEPNLRDAKLLSLPTNEEFLAEAYRRLLRRAPDLGGFRHWLAALAGGTPRQAVIDAFPAVPGNNGQADAGNQQEHVQSVELADLDVLAPADFVRESYRRILGRDGDRESLLHYRALTECGVPKRDVAAILAHSAEALPLRFLWEGAPLSPPSALTFVPRLNVLIWKIA